MLVWNKMRMSIVAAFLGLCSAYLLVHADMPFTIGVEELAHEALMRSCSNVPGFSGTNSALTWYNNGAPIPQPYDTITPDPLNCATWFTFSGFRLLITAGQRLTTVPAELWTYAGISPLFQFLNETAFAGGFHYSVAQPNEIQSVDVAIIQNPYQVSNAYCVFGGVVTSGIATNLLRFALDIFSEPAFFEIPNAFDVQHAQTVNTVKWHTVGTTTYLAIGGIANDSYSGIVSRLYIFDSITEKFTQVSSGIAGFDVQPSGTVLTGDWVDVGNDTYYLVGGTFGAHLYKLTPYGALQQVTTGSFGLNVQPGSPINSLSWLQGISPTYVAMGSTFSGGVSAYLYRLDPNTPLLNQIPGAFDVQHQANVNSVSWLNFSGTPFLFTGGVLVGGISANFYRLSLLTENFTSQPLIGQIPRDINAVSGVIFDNVPLVAVTLEVPWPISNANTAQLYATPSLVPDPYCTDAELVVTKTVDNATPSVLQNITFTITVTNRGPAVASSVVLQDVLASGLEFISSSASVGSYDSTSGLWTIGTLNANQVVTLTITARVRVSASGSTILNVASIVRAYGVTDPYPSQESAAVLLNVQTFINSVQSGAPLEYEVIAPTLQACGISVQ